ncbi:hypothetical protein B0H21DRAFT_166138 [Amylocystis lapponica]|nr:hypothetical protein B0H21DRAFT_166138 [Amylocystis lapponica]
MERASAEWRVSVHRTSVGPAIGRVSWGTGLGARSRRAAHTCTRPPRTRALTSVQGHVREEPSMSADPAARVASEVARKNRCCAISPTFILAPANNSISILSKLTSTLVEDSLRHRITTSCRHRRTVIIFTRALINVFRIIYLAGLLERPRFLHRAFTAHACSVARSTAC